MPATQRSEHLGRVVDVNQQLRRDRMRFRLVYAATALFVIFVAVTAMGTQDRPFPIALVVLVMSSLACFVRPSIGVYVIVFLTLIGDTVTSPWWPFTKNLSSRESIFFVHDSIPINPLEILLIVTTLAWLMQRLDDPTWEFRRGSLFWPLTVFTGFVLLSLGRAFAGYGDRRIAFFEARPLLYMVLVYLLVTNLFDTRRQYVRLMLLSVTAIAIQSIFSLVYYEGLSGRERAALESLSEHSATVLMDMLILFFFTVLVLRCSGWLRWMVGVMAIPVTYAYLLSQRRAAMVALFIGCATLLIILFHRRRRAFWFVAPTTVMVSLGFILGTWNARGAIGLPAKAVKSVLFPDQLTERDQNSNLYRVIESFDLWYTIRQSPITGVGFGRPFYQPYPLPDLSFFEFWEYIPHNSVLWIWLKLGFFGFVSMLFLFARAVQQGARSAMIVASPNHVAMVVAGVGYVVMFLVFAYVDIAWDPRSTVFLGFAFALCGDFVGAADVRTVHVGPARFEMVPQ